MSHTEAMDVLSEAMGLSDDDDKDKEIAELKAQLAVSQAGRQMLQAQNRNLMAQLDIARDSIERMNNELTEKIDEVIEGRY